MGQRTGSVGSPVDPRGKVIHCLDRAVARLVGSLLQLVLEPVVELGRQVLDHVVNNMLKVLGRHQHRRRLTETPGRTVMSRSMTPRLPLVLLTLRFGCGTGGGCGTYVLNPFFFSPRMRLRA